MAEQNEKMVDKPTDKENNYETLMAELSDVMKTMENSDSSLEEQLEGYEKGMKLCTELETLLKAAEERIMIINKTGQEERFV